MKYYILASAIGLMVAGCMPEPHQQTPLINGLSGSPTQIAADFDARIKAQFPVGSDAQALATELTEEGFSVKMAANDPSSPDISFEARRDDPQASCADWTVSWRAADGNITQVHGNYGQTCP